MTRIYADFWARAEKYPPCLVRLLARVDRRGPSLVMTDDQIAQRSGLTRSEVVAISWSTAWDRICMAHMRRFLTGCGFNFSNGRRMSEIDMFLKTQLDLAARRRLAWVYLRRDPMWSSYYQPLIQLYQQSLK